MAGTRFYTESGTLYHIDYEGGKKWLTRFNMEEGHGLRRDGERIKIVSCSSIEVGEPMLFMLLMDEGSGLSTMRTTSPVTRYWTEGREVSQS